MKKILLVILAFLSTVFLAACGDLFSSVEDLTNEEKMAILEEVDFSAEERYNLSVNLKLDVTEDDEVNKVDGSLKVYVDLRSKEDFTALLDYDVDMDTEEMKGSLKGMLYLDKANAYLDADLNLTTNGTEISTKSKEVMDYSDYFDIDDLFEMLEESSGDLGMGGIFNPGLAFDLSSEFFEELLQYMDFVATKDGYKIKMSLNKEKIKSLKIFKDDEYYSEMLDNLSDKSYLKSEYVISNNKLSKATLDADIKINDEDLKVILKCNFTFEMGKEAKLPKASELDKFTKVEMFSVFDKLPFY